MQASIRFGIIGCGVIGPTHAGAIAAQPGAELVAVCDAAGERAARLAAQFGAVPYADLHQMLEHEHLDVVCICTPSGYHGEHACAAMRAGAHVIVEKPMEITRQAMDEMLCVQRESGVKMAVISQHRFDAASVKIERLVREGAFGRLVLGNAHVLWWRAQSYYDSGAWRGTRALDGGGVLMNQSIHSIDLLTWLMGPVKSLWACAGTLVHRMETEDTAVCILRFASGALGTIAATTGAYPGVTTRVEIFGDRGSAVIEADELGYLHLRRDETAESAGSGGATAQPQPAQDSGQTMSNPAALAPSSHAGPIADMVDAIREGREPLLTGTNARHAVEVILGAYESAETGQEVVL